MINKLPDGRMLVKHSIAITDVLTKFMISANFQLDKIALIVSWFVFNIINTIFEYFCSIVTKSSDLFLFSIYGFP